MSVPNSQPQVYLGEPDLAHNGKPSAPRDFPPRFPRAVAGSDPRTFVCAINPTDTRHGHVFSWTHFPGGVSKTRSALAVKRWNPFHVIWEGRKKKVLCCCFFPHCYLTPIIFQVITLLGFTHSFHALCGLVVVALNCGLIIVLVYPPNTKLKHRHPHRDRCHTKWLNWYVCSKAGTFIVLVYQGGRAQSLSRQHQVCGHWLYLQAAQVDFLC